MDDNRKMTIELLAQTLAPGLYKDYGKVPEEMGFPIYDTEDEVRDHLAQQFDPVSYWLGKARSIATSVVAIMVAGGVDLEKLDLERMVKAAAACRADVDEHGNQCAMADLAER